MINYCLVFGLFVLLILLILLITNLDGHKRQQVGGAVQRCNYNINAKPCFYGSIYFQNCDGKFLTINKPYNRLIWQAIPTSNCCFLLRQPLFSIEPQPDPDIDQKYFCSIESNRFPNYFLRSNQKGELSLESAADMAIRHLERNDFIFQLEKGLNGLFNSITLRPVSPIYGNACFYDDGIGMRFTPKKCAGGDDFKNKASFHIGVNYEDYDWWWKHLSLFRYDQLNANYGGKLLGDSMSQSLNGAMWSKR